jgi:hypothetical protein
MLTPSAGNSSADLRDTLSHRTISMPIQPGNFGSMIRLYTLTSSGSLTADGSREPEYLTVK